MFKNVNKLEGPILFAKHNNIYFLGEYHHINGSSHHTHINEWIETFAKKHPNETITIILEASISNIKLLQTQSIIQPSPLKLMISSIRTLPDNIKPVLADIRLNEPFRIFVSIYDFETFVANFINADKHYLTNYKYAYHLAKQFEKDFFKNAMKTRTKCKEFLLSLIQPNMPYQDWFKDYLVKYGCSQDNVIKDCIRNINIETRKIILNKINHAITNNKHFSEAFEYAEQKRNTHSKFVAEKYKFFQVFLILLNSLFMDIYTFSLIEEESKVANHTIVMTGVNHILSILEYFPKETIEFTLDLKGTLDVSNLQKGIPPNIPILEPQSILREFMLE